VRNRLYVAGVLGAVGLLTAVVVVVFALGRYDPGPPSLERNPNPSIPGRLVYVNDDGCIVVAEASGASRGEVHCSALDIYTVTWVDENTVSFRESRPGPGTGGTVLDLRTGETRPDGISGYPMPSPVSVNGDAVSVDESGSVLVSRGGVIMTIARFDVPRRVTPYPVTWSPDGEWILLAYYPPRDRASELWILSRDGSVQGTIATGVRDTASWWIDGRGFAPALESTQK